MVELYHKQVMARRCGCIFRSQKVTPAGQWRSCLNSFFFLFFFYIVKSLQSYCQMKRVPFTPNMTQLLSSLSLSVSVSHAAPFHQIWRTARRVWSRWCSGWWRPLTCSTSSRAGRGESDPCRNRRTSWTRGRARACTVLGIDMELLNVLIVNHWFIFTSYLRTKFLRG